MITVFGIILALTILIGAIVLFGFVENALDREASKPKLPYLYWYEHNHQGRGKR